MGRRKRTHNAANLTNWHKGKKVNSNYFSDYGITLKLVIHSIVIFLPHHHHRHLSHSLAPVHLCFSLIPTVIISHPVLSQQRHLFFLLRERFDTSRDSGDYLTSIVYDM